MFAYDFDFQLGAYESSPTYTLTGILHRIADECSDVFIILSS